MDYKKVKWHMVIIANGETQIDGNFTDKQIKAICEIAKTYDKKAYYITNPEA